MSDPAVSEKNIETTTGVKPVEPCTARVCVVTAAEVEFQTVNSLLDSASCEFTGDLKLCRGVVGDKRITVLMSEIGATGFSGKLARHLAEAQYDALLVIGLGGALDARLRLGEVVAYQSCIQMTKSVATVSRTAFSKKQDDEAIASLTCDFALTRKLTEQLRANGLTCHPASGITTDRIVVEARDKQRLRERSGAAMVDMESFSVLEVCARLQLPAAVIRVVSDEAGQDLPDFNLALTPTGKISSTKAMLAMLRRPVAATRFLIHLRFVMQALRVAAKAVLP